MPTVPCSIHCFLPRMPLEFLPPISGKEQVRAVHYAAVRRFIAEADTAGLLAWLDAQGMASWYVRQGRQSDIAVIHSRALTVVNDWHEVQSGKPSLLSAQILEGATVRERRRAQSVLG